MTKKLISIVIPVFNRAHLVAETLDSILNQTYTNWECIIVDDGSTDTTLQLLETYHKRDSRIEYLQRDNTRLKGANACRNTGLEKAKGDYIVFFDSDDLMTPNHLQVKLDGIKTHKTDYVITRTNYFNHDNTKINKYYKFDDFKITPYNYISQKINWLTYDVIIKKELAKSIQFNENLQSGQEYNYFSKLVLKSTNAIFVDQVVTLRRKHDGSIRARLKTKSDLRKSYFYAMWNTYLDVKDTADKKSKIFLLKSCIVSIHNEKNLITKNKLTFIKEVLTVFKARGIYFLMLLVTLKFGKGYCFISKLEKK